MARWHKWMMLFRLAQSSTRPHGARELGVAHQYADAAIESAQKAHGYGEITQASLDRLTEIAAGYRALMRESIRVHDPELYRKIKSSEAQ